MEPDSAASSDDELDDDMELGRLRAELGHLVDSGDEAFADARSLRLMERVVRRRLALRTLRGDHVTAGEVAEIMRLDLRIRHLEMFEAARELTRDR